MWGALRPSSPHYARYLETQLRRTISKNNNQLQPRTIYLVDKLAELVELQGKEVLCVGCRNHAELEYIAGKGAKKVTGIDLFSSHPDILVMDMHQMTFPDNSFDIVYSSHSLEHALEPHQVAREISRVLHPDGVVVIEVPVAFHPRGADLLNLGDHQGIYDLFVPYQAIPIWQESGILGQEMAIARAVFKLREK